MKHFSWLVLAIGLFVLAPAFVQPSGASAAVLAMPGQNIVCKTSGTTQICASVSSASPKQYSYVTIYGRLTVSGVGQNAKSMTIAWHYKTVTSSCSGKTNTSGLANCARYISSATKGYKVNVVVTINGRNVTTSFTPY